MHVDYSWEISRSETKGFPLKKYLKQAYPAYQQPKIGQQPAISRKSRKLRCKLVLFTITSTGNCIWAFHFGHKIGDLKWPWTASCPIGRFSPKMLGFRAYLVKLAKLDPYCLWQKCSPTTLVFDNIYSLCGLGPKQVHQREALPYWIIWDPLVSSERLQLETWNFAHTVRTHIIHP